MSEAQTYYDGLIAQGHAPEGATQYTQQHFPGFVPAAVAPAPAAVPAPAPAPAMGAPAANPEAMAYYQGLLTQGHDPASAQSYTQQHFPGFQL